MEECLICGKECKNKKSLGCHVKLHGLTAKEYKERFDLIRKCNKCGSELSRKCSGDYCNHCRDRAGENNSFYGKTHSEETIKIIKDKTSISSKLLWQDNEYREKVIGAVSKPRREGFKKEQSERTTQWYVDNPEQLEIRSVAMKKSWANGRIQSNLGYSINHSKGELDLKDAVEELAVGETNTNTIECSDGTYVFPDIRLDHHGYVIEYYGNYWHANPEIYGKDDTINGKTAQEIWDHDNNRNKKIDHCVMVVWESEWKKNRHGMLNKIDMILNWECGI